MIGNAGPFGVGGDRDSHRKRPFAKDSLVRRGRRDEILQVDTVAVPDGRPALTNHDDIERNMYRTSRCFTFGVDLAQHPIERDVRRLARRTWREDSSLR